MVFTEIKLDSKFENLLNSELKNGQLQLHTLKEIPQEKFWWVRVISAFLIPMILSIPLFIMAFFENIFKKRKCVKGKVILITGAARGLGRGMALALAKRGALIACVDINTKGVEETVSMINSSGGKAVAFTVNVGKTDQIHKLRMDVEKSLGQVDILVNNAAILMATPVSEWEEQQIRGFYEVNLFSHLWMIKEFLPGMRQRKSGHVVTLSSGSGLMACPYLSLYGSSKAAISNLSDGIRLEMEMLKIPIKFTAIHPIFINTSLEVATFCNLRIPVMTEEYAVSEIVDAILYEKERTALPESVTYFAVWDRLMPKNIRQMTMKILNPTICLPERKIRQALPSERIIEDTLKK